ncbi:MAG: hypothetical protein AAF558_09685 [Verrucomicrobiota bacterium]
MRRDLDSEKLQLNSNEINSSTGRIIIPETDSVPLTGRIPAAPVPSQPLPHAPPPVVRPSELDRTASTSGKWVLMGSVMASIALAVGTALLWIKVNDLTKKVDDLNATLGHTKKDQDTLLVDLNRSVGATEVLQSNVEKIQGVLREYEERLTALKERQETFKSTIETIEVVEVVDEATINRATETIPLNP